MGRTHVIAERVADLLSDAEEILISHSSRSESAYVYAWNERGHRVSIRISKHQNQVCRPDRVTGLHDRTEACDVEIRLDMSPAWRWAVDAARDILAGRAPKQTISDDTYERLARKRLQKRLAAREAAERAASDAIARKREAWEGKALLMFPGLASKALHASGKKRKRLLQKLRRAIRNAESCSEPACHEGGDI